MACGYEQPLDGATGWHHRGRSGKPDDTCPGYTATLPEVIETSRLRAHWKVGALHLACHEGPPTPMTLDGILTLEWEQNAVENWRADEARRKSR